MFICNEVNAMLLFFNPPSVFCVPVTELFVFFPLNLLSRCSFVFYDTRLRIYLIYIGNRRLVNKIAFVIRTSDHNDTNASIPAELNGARDLFTRGIQHTNAADEGQVSLRDSTGIQQ